MAVFSPVCCAIPALWLFGRTFVENTCRASCACEAWSSRRSFPPRAERATIAHIEFAGSAWAFRKRADGRSKGFDLHANVIYPTACQTFEGRGFLRREARASKGGFELAVIPSKRDASLRPF